MVKEATEATVAWWSRLGKFSQLLTAVGIIMAFLWVVTASPLERFIVDTAGKHYTPKHTTARIKEKQDQMFDFREEQRAVNTEVIKGQTEISTKQEIIIDILKDRDRERHYINPNGPPEHNGGVLGSKRKGL